MRVSERVWGADRASPSAPAEHGCCVLISRLSRRLQYLCLHVIASSEKEGEETAKEERKSRREPDLLACACCIPSRIISAPPSLHNQYHNPVSAIHPIEGLGCGLT